MKDACSVHSMAESMAVYSVDPMVESMAGLLDHSMVSL